MSFPIFEVVPSKAGAGWNVMIQLRSDRVQYVCGFDTELEADDWIRRDASGWLRALDAKL